MKNHKKIFIGAIIIILAVLIALGICGISVKAYDETEDLLWTDQMIALHEEADWLRSLGYSNNSDMIQGLKKAWEYEKYQLSLIARVIEGEAGDCPYDHQVAVGAVLWNRVHHERFPNTVEECIRQPGQYTLLYLSGFEQIRESCWRAAIDVMNGNTGVPWYVVWQAEFPQGNGTWWISDINTGWYASRTYFCYGVYGGGL